MSNGWEDGLVNVPEVVRRAEVEQSAQRARAEEAKLRAATAIAEAMPFVVSVLMDCLTDDDRQVRLRAADILLSRAIPKIAAKHVDEDPNTISDSPDTAALRESILEEIRKRR